MEYCNGEKKLEDVKGIVYRSAEGVIKRTLPRPVIKQLDDLPPIPYHLINLKSYTAVGFRPGKPSMALVTSRGCQFRCTFCSIVALSKSVDEEGNPLSNVWRGYSVGRIMGDLRHLDDIYGIKDFYFNDDLISGNNKRFTDLVNALVEANEVGGRDWNWGTAGIRGDHVLRLSDEIIKKLVRSGCRNLDVGVESGNPRIMKLMKKDTTPEVIRRANQKMKNYPIIIKYTFMGGFPTETEEEFLDTLTLRRTLQEENEYATCPIFFYTPFPKTEMFQLAIDNGFKPPTTLQEWADFNYNTWYNIYPCWLTQKKINLVENAVFLSYFSNQKMLYKFPNPLLRMLFKAYYPIAKYRYEHNIYNFMIEKNLADVLAKVNNKFNLFNRSQKKNFASASSNRVESSVNEIVGGSI